MKKIKTIFILEFLIDGLHENQSVTGVIELIVFMSMSNTGLPESIAQPELAIFRGVTNEEIKVEILRQHPTLIPIIDSAERVTGLLDEGEWLRWRDKQIARLGEELSLAPCKEEMVKIL